jgi:hypothetical protein
MRPGLHFFKQPRALDGDDCLVGEGLDKLYLAVVEWLHLRPRKGQYAKRLALAQKWHREQLRILPTTTWSLRPSSGSMKIGHMHSLPFENGSSGERGAIRGYWVVLQILCKRRIDYRVREQIEPSPSPAPHGGSFGRAEALGGLHNGVDHRLQLRR